MGHEGHVLLADCPGYNDRVRGLPLGVAPTAQSCHEAWSCFSGHREDGAQRVPRGLWPWEVAGAWCLSFDFTLLLAGFSWASDLPTMPCFLPCKRGSYGGGDARGGPGRPSVDLGPAPLPHVPSNPLRTSPRPATALQF